MTTITEFTFIIIGDGGVGKSTFTRKCATNKFKEQYDSTYGVSFHTFEQETNKGLIKITIIDTAGQEKFGSLRSELYTDYKIDGALIMFDLTSRITYTHIPNWHSDLTSSKGDDFPTVIIGNKVDMQRKVKSTMVKYPTRKNIPYHEISVKDSTNFYDPFNSLFQKLLNDCSIECIYPDSESVIDQNELTEPVE